MQGGHIGRADYANETPLTFLAEAKFLIRVVEVDASDRRRAQASQASGLRHPIASHLDEALKARVQPLPRSYRSIRSLKARRQKGGKS